MKSGKLKLNKKTAIPVLGLGTWQLEAEDIKK